MRKIFLALAVLLISSGLSVQAQYTKAPKTCLLTRSLSIDSLVNNSAIIFRGKFLGSTNTTHNGLDVRELEFAISEGIKGIVDQQSKITLKEWARVKSPFVDQIKPDQDYVFFFHEPSARGLTSLNGFEQGYVAIDKKGQLSYSPRVSLKQSQGFFLQTLFRTSQARADLKTYQGLKKYCQKPASSPKIM